MTRKPDFSKLAKNSMPFVLALVLTFAVALTFLSNHDTHLLTELERFVDWKFVGQASIEDAKAELESEKQALQAKQEELNATMNQTQELMNQTQELMNQLNALKQDTLELLDKAEQEGSAVKDKIDEMKDAYEKLEELEQQQWLMPIKYDYVSSDYGYRLHPIEGVVKFHSGIDLSAAHGTPIVASRSGTVKTTAYEADGAGYHVVIDHLDGYTTRYLHMSRYIVQPGQFVVAGQIIGYCGSTGASTGPHLHFTVVKNGQYVDPKNYIDFS